MNFLRDIADQARRAVVDVLDGAAIERDCPVRSSSSSSSSPRSRAFCWRSAPPSSETAAAAVVVTAPSLSSRRSLRFVLPTYLRFLRKKKTKLQQSSAKTKQSPVQDDDPFSPDVPEDVRQWMPDIFDRFPIVLPWASPQPVDPSQHQVWIFDNTAFRAPSKADRKQLELAAPEKDDQTEPVVRSADGALQRAGDRSGWEVELVAAYFVKDSGSETSRVVAQLARLLHIGESDVASRERIAARLEPFTATVLPKRTVRVAVGDAERQTLGPSNYSGISQAVHALHIAPPRVPDMWTTAPVDVPASASMPGHTVFAEAEGWGVISDIDDTIKVTQSPSPLGILHNTFVVDQPEPVAGTPELYARIDTALDRPAWFYLSASPYNLYPFLKRFRDAHFPCGTMILRNASWQNLGGLIASLQRGTQAYKVSRVSKIHSWFPGRRFIAIGDSTQSDPESYGECARRFPGWFRAIFIRRVEGIDELDEAEKNSDARFEKAFAGLDRGLWRVYTDASELAPLVDDLTR